MIPIWSFCAFKYTLLNSKSGFVSLLLKGFNLLITERGV